MSLGQCELKNLNCSGSDDHDSPFMEGFIFVVWCDRKLWNINIINITLNRFRSHGQVFKSFVTSYVLRQIHEHIY